MWVQQMKILLVLLSSLLLSACETPREEKDRIVSPSKEFDAIIATTSPGAIGPNGFHIHIVLHGNALDEFPVFTATHVQSINVKWMGDRRLSISAERADVFASRIQKRIMRNGEEVVISVWFDVARQGRD